MIDEKLAQFETNVESLVESVFSSLFRKKLRAQDIALQLARALEQYSHKPDEHDNRPIAPDHYSIHLNAFHIQQLSDRKNSLQQSLSQHMVILAMQAGYRLNGIPIIDFVNDEDIEIGRCKIFATHSSDISITTRGMPRIEIVESAPAVSKAFLIINSQRSISLSKDITSIGRMIDNDIVLDDPYVSRYHIQIRRRGNEYIMFDIRKRSNTFVNNVLVNEHRLHSGDVLKLGNTTLVFMEEILKDDNETTLPQTEPLD